MPAATLAMSPRARTIVYAVIGFVSLGLGAAQVAYATLEAPLPDWLRVALAVVPFLAAGLGYTAATHTPSEKNVVQPGRHLDGDGDGIADAAQQTGRGGYTTGQTIPGTTLNLPDREGH